jgi:hypothetical protein
MSSLIIFLPAVDPVFDEAGNTIGSVGSLLLWILMLNVLLNLPVDVFSSYAVFRMGRGLGLRSAWVAWLPGGNLWVMGCIADQYHQLTRGRKSYLRWMLPLHAAWAVLLWFCTCTQGPTAQALLSLADRFLLIPAILSIGGIVAVYTALNRVYRYTTMGDGVLFTALGLLFSVPTPFFLLHSAKEW